VAEELNFGRAAARLHMAQPPLSVQIKALEKDLGVTLFDRSARQIRLTKEGEVFLYEARRLIEQSERAQRSVHNAAVGILGTLSVSGVASAFHDLLPRVIPQFRRTFPEVALSLTEVDTADAMDAVAAGTIDVAFVRVEQAAPEFNVMPLRKDQLVVVLPRDHALAASEQIALQDLADDLWVMPKRVISPDYHDVILTTLKSAGLSPKVALEGASIHSQIAFVACGLGVALVPESASRVVSPAVRVVPLDVHVSLTELAAVWAAGEPSSIVSNFLRIVDRTHT